MKKLSMIAATFAVMFAMASCSSPADKAVEYCEAMKAAALANDVALYEKVEKEAMAWKDGLSAEDQKAAEAAVEAWMKANPMN